MSQQLERMRPASVTPSLPGLYLKVTRAVAVPLSPERTAPLAIDLNQMQDPLGLLRLGYAKPLLELRAQRWEKGASDERTEQVVEETPVVLVYNGIPHVVMMATPVDLEDFALGFSITEELIRGPADLKSVEVVRYSQGIEIQTGVAPECNEVIASRTRRLTGRTGCGICGADSIAAVLKQLHTVAPGQADLPRRHRAGDPVAPDSPDAQRGRRRGTRRRMVVPRRHRRAGPRGRGPHNALDKLVGALLKRGFDPGPVLSL